MAPALLIEPHGSPQITAEECLLKGANVCSDPLVVPSNRASRRTKELWWLHGNPHSRRYADPKLISLSALVRHAGVTYKSQRAFLFPLSAKSSTPYSSMTWEEFDCVTGSIALSYAVQLQNELKVANQTQKQPTVALLGAGKTLDYFCTEIALQKLGLRVLLLAESNAESALHYLLETCEAVAVIVDSKNACTDVGNIRKLELIEKIPEVSYNVSADIDAVKFQDYGDIWERHTFIIHSSGSTGVPKPIYHTNRSMMLIARMYRLFQEFDIENWFLLFPLYHIAGISIALSGLPNGQILSFPPISWPPSASSIFTAFKTLSAMGHPVDCVHCAPTLIETMYDYILDNGEDFSPLAALKLLQPGGAVLSDSIIQDMTNHGVNVKTTYGSTEIGPPLRSIPHTRANPRCYSFRNLYPDNPFIKMAPMGEGTYECVVYKGFDLAADLWQGKPDNEPYRTNDIFVQDPPGSGFYVMQGRKDDILVHTNGENTSAGSLQLDIQTSSKLINKVLALGHSLPCVSLLVEVHEDQDPTSVLTYNKVWQAVKKINSRYPSHSQIMKGMIYILPKGHHLPVTPKGNVKRKEAERQYSSAIEGLYASIAAPSDRLSTSQQPLSEFLRALLARLVSIPSSQINDTTSFYDLGIDSRLALDIRTSLSSHLNRPISLSNIFENPSIAQLVSALSSTPSSRSASPSEPTSTQIIQRMITKLSSEFRAWPPRPAPSITGPIKVQPKGEIVLLTGATGSLGTALLETLSASPNVTKIYALVRGPNLSSRLLSALSSRGIDGPTLLNNPNSKISVLNFSMQDPLLGLDISTYHLLAQSVTLVIQNAWKMDFNLSVADFEGDCIRSTISLLRFCHAGVPKRMAFTSSISTCLGAAAPALVPEEKPSDDPTSALPTGYAQSKYITEHLLFSSAKILQIPTVLLRVGQLCGSTRTGIWNTDEMWPIMFATSACVGMKALPEFPGRMVDWVPVDVAAATITELLAAKVGGMKHGCEVHNIVSPSLTPWSSFLSMLQGSGLASDDSSLEVVPMAEWVRRLNVLADAGASPDEVPGLRLLGFWEDMVEEAGKESIGKVFETAKSCVLAPSLRGLDGFREEWLHANVRAWTESGFLGSGEKVE